MLEECISARFTKCMLHPPKRISCLPRVRLRASQNILHQSNYEKPTFIECPLDISFLSKNGP